MTPQQYEKVLNGYPMFDTNLFGQEERIDFVGNSDLPFMKNETRIDILNYYYFWFPLVKDHI